MNVLRYTSLTVEERVIVYFELAKNAKSERTVSEMITGAIALMLLLQDADIDKRATAERLRKEAKRCGVDTTSVLNTIDAIERG